MTTLNSPDTADGISRNPGDLNAAMSSAADAAVSTAASITEEATTGRWGDSIRTTVRDNPLAALGVAALLGMLLARRSR